MIYSGILIRKMRVVYVFIFFQYLDKGVYCKDLF